MAELEKMLCANGCGRPAWAVGKCSRCYQVDRAKRAPSGEVPKCVEPDCVSSAVAKDRCPKHYQVWRKARKPGQDGATQCRRCKETAYALGLCAAHYGSRRRRLLKRTGAEMAQPEPGLEAANEVEVGTEHVVAVESGSATDVPTEVVTPVVVVETTPQNQA